MKIKKQVFLIVNIIFPLFTGAVLYYLIAPNVLFVRQLDLVFGSAFHLTDLDYNLWYMRFIRFYLLDMVWGYALVSSLYFVIGESTAQIPQVLMIAVIFSAIIEYLQLFPFLPGTFDEFDLLAEAMTEVCAVCVIYIFYRGGSVT